MERQNLMIQVDNHTYVIVRFIYNVDRRRLEISSHNLICPILQLLCNLVERYMKQYTILQCLNL